MITYQVLLNDELEDIRKGVGLRPVDSELGIQVREEVHNYIVNERPGLADKRFPKIKPENHYVSLVLGRICTLRNECEDKVEEIIKEKKKSRPYKCMVRSRSRFSYRSINEGIIY